MPRSLITLLIVLAILLILYLVGVRMKVYTVEVNQPGNVSLPIGDTSLP